MTRACVILRYPAVWLGLLLFAAAVWVGHRYSPPEPEAVVRTGNERYPNPRGGHILHVWGEPSGWSVLHGVSDDNGQILTGFYEGGKCVESGRLQEWDVQSGQGRTLLEWGERGGIHGWLDPSLQDHPEGLKFLRDEAVHESMRKRLARTEMHVDEQHTEWPSGLQFSPDGRVLSYLTRNGKPVYHAEWLEEKADSTAVEDARTGERVAFLSGVTERLDLAPGGKTAVSSVNGSKWDDPKRLILWDLTTSTRRAEYSPGLVHVAIHFDPCGRYVFVNGSTGDYKRHELLWWDTATGCPVGRVHGTRRPAFVGNGAVLVTNPERLGQGRSYFSSRLCFWDVATGASVGHWDLEFDTNPNDLVGSAHPRYLYGQVYVKDTLTDRVVDRLERAFGNTPQHDRERFVVWDVVERREILRVPGKSAALSPNGQRLATIDDAGVVRVWQLPPPVPWGRILWQAVLAAVIGGPALVLFGRLVGHTWRSARATCLGRVGRWLLTGWRRWWTRAAGVLALLAVLGWVGYAILAERARAEMRAAFEDIYATPGLTEAEVTARIGRSPDAGQVLPMAERGKGGGDDRSERTLRKWTRYGTEMDVFFGPDGKEQGVYISDAPGLLDRLARWLGL